MILTMNIYERVCDLFVLPETFHGGQAWATIELLKQYFWIFSKIRLILMVRIKVLEHWFPSSSTWLQGRYRFIRRFDQKFWSIIAESPGDFTQIKWFERWLHGKLWKWWNLRKAAPAESHRLGLLRRAIRRFLRFDNFVELRHQGTAFHHNLLGSAILAIHLIQWCVAFRPLLILGDHHELSSSGCAKMVSATSTERRVRLAHVFSWQEGVWYLGLLTLWIPAINWHWIMICADSFGQYWSLPFVF